ncbi:hypothetical protein UFOVP679_13 [uncultured Caudovirales phage]|uniref:Uncharacterized protein n=1 Tax=uncultured Caudovirales phage TaxID=2100421 RepID=A0A6J5NC45_9CAUD|nr:hypothetical protein UFOVP679_13 [uncultured Caudovirales phage]
MTETREIVTDREPVAWLHVMTYETGDTRATATLSPQHPWGIPGVDFSKKFTIVSTPLTAAPPPTAPTVATPAMLDAGWKATGEAQVFAGTDTPETRPGWRVLDGEVNLSDVWSAMASVARPAPIVEDVLSMIDEWVRSEQSFSLGAAMPLSRRNRLAARIIELFQGKA